MNLPIQSLLGTSLRISELAALRVSDVETSERKGNLYVRAGKGSKARQIPLGKQPRERQPTPSTDTEDGND